MQTHAFDDIGHSIELFVDDKLHFDIEVYKNAKNNAYQCSNEHRPYHNIIMSILIENLEFSMSGADLEYVFRWE